MTIQLDSWQFIVGSIVGGFIIGLCFRRFWQGVCALMEFEYRAGRCKEQADRIQHEFDRVMTMERDTNTLRHLEQRFGHLGQEFEKLRRECGK